jgi:cytoskeletal protein RodZ
MPNPHPRLRAVLATGLLALLIAAVVGVGVVLQEAPDELHTEIAMASEPSTPRAPSPTVRVTTTTEAPPETTAPPTTEAPTTTTTQAPTTTTTAKPAGPSEAELAARAEAQAEADRAAAAQAQAEADQAAAEAAEAERLAAEAAPPAPTSSTGIPDSYWDRMAVCETGGNWAHYPGARWSGGLGMYTPEWLSISGGKYGPSAGHATREQQIEIANQWVEKYGGVHGGGLNGWGCLSKVGYP